MKSKDKDDGVVAESNALARATLNPPVESIWEERVISQMAAFNSREDTEFPERAFMIGRLTRKHLTGKQFTQIQKACERLVGTTFTLTYSRDKFKVFSVFEYLEYEDGIITGKFNRALKPHYLQLKREFALRSLPEFRELSRVHSQQIYRLLNSWKGLGSVKIKMEQLHAITNATKTQVENFKEFRVKVIEPSLKEIREKTCLDYQYEPIKDGRKVVAIRFFVTPRKPLPNLGDVSTLLDLNA